jgi:hypothetical protein
MPSMMAMRTLKRRLSNVVFARMPAGQKRREASPGGQPGTPADSSAAGPDPRTPTPGLVPQLHDRHDVQDAVDAPVPGAGEPVPGLAAS